MIEHGAHRLDSMAQARRILRGHGWATLIAEGPSGIEASHTPCLLDPHRDEGDEAPGLVILGHVGRPDPITPAILGGKEALLIFAGPHGYVSPTWYGEGTYVQTLNYVTVHARGPLEPLEDEDCLEVLRATIDHFEAPLPEPWSLDGGDAEPYARRIVGGAVGFRMTTTRVTARAKLSQEKPLRIRERVVDVLDAGASGGLALAEEMRLLAGGG